MQKRRVVVAGFGLAMALVAAACGSSSNSKGADSGATTTKAGAATTTATTAGGATTTKAAGTATTTGGATTSAGATTGKGGKMSILFDLRGRGDKSFNDSAAVGLDKAKAEFGYSVTEAVRTGNDTAELLKKAADDKNTLVIGVGFAWAEEMGKAAAANPSVHYAIVDDSSINLPNVSGLVFKANEGSFLVGAAAALKSKSGQIGFIGGVDIPLIQDFYVGFEAGAKAVNPAIKIASTYISPAGDFSGFSDAAKAKTIALKQYEDGADVIYHAAGGSGDGLFGAAKEFSAKGKKVWAIGVDSDQALTQPADLAPYILTSMIKHVDVAVYETMKAEATSSFKGGTRVFAAKDGGVDYATTGGFLDDVKSKLDGFKADIASGKIVVPTKG